MTLTMGLLPAVGRQPLTGVWVNPDCGLKTRKAPETEAALRNMVDAAQQVRATIGEPAPTA